MMWKLFISWMFLLFVCLFWFFEAGSLVALAGFELQIQHLPPKCRDSSTAHSWLLLPPLLHCLSFETGPLLAQAGLLSAGITGMNHSLNFLASLLSCNLTKRENLGTFLFFCLVFFKAGFLCVALEPFLEFDL
ncbi:hypothetical protein I79_005706 [Cricetulus griseus]|uniref:Uncharacterized protein n=1 Tax=Cricetulus griseus TaxID=10029 RepID=G3H5W2_CRIGR|nr:hypothetical protein I79_005706 [Cricetulus griseus]